MDGVRDGVDSTELAIAGAWVVTPVQHADARGVFVEAFKEESIREVIGHPSTSGRSTPPCRPRVSCVGCTFADVPPSQAKYVMCLSGAVLDVVVDVRVGSPTFGQWDSVVLDDVDRRAVYLSEGLGHAFCSLQDGSTVVYRCSEPYEPGREHALSPLCSTLAIAWPAADRDGNPFELVLSARDRAAPDLPTARRLGLLPDFQQTDRFIASRRVRESHHA